MPRRLLTDWRARASAPHARAVALRMPVEPELTPGNDEVQNACDLESPPASAYGDLLIDTHLPIHLISAGSSDHLPIDIIMPSTKILGDGVACPQDSRTD